MRGIKILDYGTTSIVSFYNEMHMDSGNLTGAGTHCSYGIKNFFLINR